MKNDGDIRGSWAPARNDEDQWLQVDLGNPNTTVAGVATQGRDNYDWWVMKYKLHRVNHQPRWNYMNTRKKAKTTAR